MRHYFEAEMRLLSEAAQQFAKAAQTFETAAAKIRSMNRLKFAVAHTNLTDFTR